MKNRKAAQTFTAPAATKSEPAPTDEFMALHQKLKEANHPEPADIQRYRELAQAHPDRVTITASMSELVRHHLMNRLVESSGIQSTFLIVEEDRIKKELGYHSSSQMEKLIIEQILTTKLHLLHAEHVFNQKILDSKTYAEGDYWQRFFSAAHRRHLQAVESLARVRRLMRGGPFLQVNIANHGGKQVNVQGELFQSSPTAPSTESKSINLS